MKLFPKDVVRDGTTECAACSIGKMSGVYFIIVDRKIEFERGDPGVVYALRVGPSHPIKPAE